MSNPNIVKKVVVKQKNRRAKVKHSFEASSENELTIESKLFN
jgi:hypothetical protein